MPRSGRDAPAGVVAAGHRLSARAGAEALARGGNAVDAVVAAAYTAAVCESPLTGPGAGGFMLSRSPGGRTTLLDFFVSAPGLGPRGRRLSPEDLDQFTVEFGGADQVFHIGPASVAVPGMVAGLGEAARRLGTLPALELVEAAARAAREGVVLSAESGYLHRILTGMLTHSPEAAAIYAPGGRLLDEGDVLRNPELAESLIHLARAGAQSLYEGELAGLLVDHLERTGGLVTREDLRGYRVIDRVPLTVGFRDVSVLTNPPPSAGGALIAAALAVLGTEGPAPDEPARCRAVVRAGRRANRLRTPEFAAGLHQSDSMERLWARLSDEDDDAGRQGEDRKPAGSTTHISAVDDRGGMASLSSSNGSGSGVVLPGTGILLNNMLGEQDLNPAGFGATEPGVRITSMMAPTLLLRDGRPLAALGAAGSNRLRSAILQTIVAVVDGGLTLREAVDRPRVHPEGDGVDVEGGVGEPCVEALLADGHRLRRWGGMNLFFGGVSIAGHDAHGPSGAGDPRRGGAAALATRSGEVIDL
ncbi:MAG: gamma-glutamyltransferase [Miltoncostaeaceae bacterium]